MGKPLELSYNWRPSLVASTAALVICLLVLGLTRVTGWASVVALVTLIWATYAAAIYVRTRAFLRVDGPTLTVRHITSLHKLTGSQVKRVTESFTRQGPCHKLTVQTEAGVRRYQVPTALLQGGHSTLFTWLLQYAPQAELDKGSTKTLEQLRIRGLVE